MPLGARFSTSVTVLAALLVLALAGISWAWVVRAQRGARDALADARAREIAGQISGELRNLVDTFDRIAANRLLSNALMDSEGLEGYLRPYLGSIRSVGGVPVRITLCDFQGAPIISNGDEAPAIPPALLPAVIERGQPQALVGGHERDPELFLWIPVVFPGTRRAEGVLATAVRLADVAERELDARALGGRAALAAGDRVLLSTGSGAAGRRPSEQQVDAPAPLDALRLRIVLHPAPPPAPVGLAAFFAALAAASVGAFAAIARVLADRLTRPVAGLTAVAEQISETGQLHGLPPLEGEGEAARLARAFGGMIARVQDAQGRLEERVRERTAELERANAGLRREMEERRRVERFAERVFASVGQGLAVLDRRFTVLTANAAFAAVAGRASPDDVVGQRCHALLFGRDKPCDAYGEPCPAAWVLARGAAATGELVVRDRALDTRCFPLKDEAGSVDSVIYAFNDVTERRALAEQVREAQKMEAIGHLAGGVAHDFNNIVAVVMGNAAVLRSEIGSDPPKVELVDEILAAAKRAKDLNGQLLAFGRKQTLRPRPLDPGAVVDGVRQMLRTLLTEDVELRIDRGDRVPAVLADRGQLEQVVVNLVANARDAMPAGGVVSITTRVASRDESAGGGPAAVISVADTGTGMDAGTRARIFEPFFTTKPRDKGTGLGLAVVYGIVTSHGGRIHVESQPGKGSRFDVILPGTSVRPEEADALERGLGSVRGGGELILLAEDEERIRRLFRRVLEGQGYRVVEARDGREALGLLRDPRQEIALALLDVVMPGANGPEVLEEARHVRPGLRAVMVSGYASDVLESRGGLDPSVTLLPKPCLPAELLSAIRRTLDEPERRDQ
jgi:signal transduction histidine kinase/CheY-like chemotaxis protein